MHVYLSLEKYEQNQKFESGSSGWVDAEYNFSINIFTQLSMNKNTHLKEMMFETQLKQSR